jgi:Bacterial Ig domain
MNGCGVLFNDVSSKGVFAFYDAGRNPISWLLPTPRPASLPGGTLQLLTTSGDFRFTPAAGFAGTVEFYYSTLSTTNDGPDNDVSLHLLGAGPQVAGLYAGRVTINVVAPPAIVPGYKPLALDDSYASNEDTPLNFAPNAFVQNDVGASYGGVISGPVHGTVEHDLCTFSEWQLFRCIEIGRLEAIIYTPHPDYNGLDSFRYNAVGDQAGTIAQVEIGTVNVFVNRVRDQPALQPDSFSAKRAEPAVLDVLANDYDPDGLIDPSTVGLEFQPASEAGDLSLGGDGTFLYTPDGSESPKAFSYRATTTDGQAVTAATFTVNVDPNPAVDDSYTINEDTLLTVGSAGGALYRFRGRRVNSAAWI